MIGIILILASWALLRMERKPLSVLGFNRPVQRLSEFVIGFIVAGAFACAQFLSRAHFGDFSWVQNPQFTLLDTLNGLRWIVNSVLYEELIFRGYLLYKAIELLGPRRGCYLSAVAFGIYHWFSYGVFGALIPMVWVFLLTGSFGLMCSFAFERSKSVILPIGLHLGWNVAAILVFSSGPIGGQLLVQSPAETPPLGAMPQVLINLALPLSLTIFVLWIIVRRVPMYGASGRPAA